MSEIDPQLVQELATELMLDAARDIDYMGIGEAYFDDDRCAHLDDAQKEALQDAINEFISEATVTVTAPTEDEQPTTEQDGDVRAVPTFPEDKRGRYLDSEGIGAGAEGSQLITWGGDVDQIEVRAPHRNRVFMALGMLGLDPYKSPETCPQVRLTLTDEHARQLADGIYAALDARDAKAGG